MNGKLFVFSGPSGSGKTGIVQAMLKFKELKTEFSVSATSRKKRFNEKHGKDYYFLSPEEFKQKINEDAFVEWEEVYENFFYGTLHSELERIFKNDKNVIFDVDVSGGLNIKKKFRHNCLTVFVMPPSLEELEKRLRLRATETEESISERLLKARFEINFAEQFDYILINDIFENAVNEAFNLLKEFITE
jgi:guanylate kinase